MPIVYSKLGFQPVPEYQTPATLSQAAAVQNTWYTILDTTENIRVYQVVGRILTTGEDLEVQITVDGETIACTGVSCVAGSTYYIIKQNANDADKFTLVVREDEEMYPQAYLIEGRSVKIEIRKTSANGAGTLLGLAQYGRYL